MRRILALLAAATFALPAWAACPAADRLVDEYGISFGGFEKAIPKVAQPNAGGTRADALVVIRLPNKKGNVPDGFRHSAVVDKEKQQAWIRRRGGFVPVDEWYGPVKVEGRHLAGCVVEAWR